MNRLVFAVLSLCSFALIATSSAQQSIAVRVYLEGALANNGGQTSSQGLPLMRDELRVNPFTGSTSIPITDPYFYPMANFDISPLYLHVESPNNQSLHQIANPSAVLAVTGENAIVDWIHVQIRSMQDSTTIIASRSGLLQRDGDVVDLDGVSNLYFSNLTATKFYVVVKHRMHLGVMSKLMSQGQAVDFTNPQTPTYDLGPISNELNYTGMSQNATAMNGYKALWAGDLNGDGTIKFTGGNDDTSIIFLDVVTHADNPNFLTTFNNTIGYYNSDIDMNGKSKYTNPSDDGSYIYGQILSYPLNKRLILNFDLLKEQVPRVKS